MYTENGITVVVNPVKHLPKCIRCQKYSKQVDLDPVFPQICYRCSSVMHAMFYDVNFGNNFLLPPKLTRDVNEFIQKYVRPELRHLSWQEIQDQFKDYAIPSDEKEKLLE